MVVIKILNLVHMLLTIGMVYMPKNVIGKEQELWMSQTNWSRLVYQQFAATPDRYSVHLPRGSDATIYTQLQIDPRLWQAFSPRLRYTVWRRFRSQLYWRCLNVAPESSDSCCPAAAAPVRLQLQAQSRSQLLLHCCLCLLTATVHSNPYEMIGWPHLLAQQHHLYTVVIGRLSSLLSNRRVRDDSLLLTLSRSDHVLDSGSTMNTVNLTFITNISLIQSEQIQLRPQTKCRFICGWGPQCLADESLACDGVFDCDRGEDEHELVCHHGRQVSTSSTTWPQHPHNSPDSRVLSQARGLIFIPIFGVLSGLLLVALVWLCCCRHQQRRAAAAASTRTELYSSSSGSKSITSKALLLSANKSQNCQYCSRHRVSCSSSIRSNSLAVDKALIKMKSPKKQDTGAVNHSVVSLPYETQFHNQQRHYHHHNRRQKLREHQLHKLETSYSQDDGTAVAANRVNGSSNRDSDWLNLFYLISSEARQHSFLSQPPPNHEPQHHDNQDLSGTVVIGNAAQLSASTDNQVFL